MRWWSWLVVIAAGGYSGHAAPGAPCTPSLDNCPRNQTCALVSGEYICVEGAVPDAASAMTDADIDAMSPLIDAPVTSPDAPPPMPWSLIKTAETTNTNQGLSFAATGAGHLIVVGLETPSAGAVTAVADNAGNTYAPVPIGRAISTVGDIGLEVWYAKNASAATTITVTAPSVRAIVMWEVANIKTANPLDTSTKVENQAASTTPLGAAITTTQARELVISVAIVDNFISGIHANSAFTNDRLALGNGWAHLTSNNAPAGTYQAQWDQGTAGASCSISAAFFIGP